MRHSLTESLHCHDFLFFRGYDFIHFLHERIGILLDILFEVFFRILRKGYRFFTDSPTNQQFPILPHSLCGELLRNATFELWAHLDDHQDVVRFATSWATREEGVDALLELL